MSEISKRLIALIMKRAFRRIIIDVKGGLNWIGESVNGTKCKGQSSSSCDLSFGGLSILRSKLRLYFSSVGRQI